MLGPVKSRDLSRQVVISLEQLVPVDHFYRHLERELDLAFVRDWVRECYAPNGRPSIDPVVFFKLELARFFEGLRSERQLMRVAADHLSIRWYVGYNLDESLPDHSSLTRIHQRLGLPLFRRFFDHVIELCDKAGLIWGKELLVDATKVRANAAVSSLDSRLREVIDAHLVDLFADSEDGSGEDPSSASGCAMTSSKEDRSRIRTGAAPQSLAALHNIIRTSLHHSGHRDIMATCCTFAAILAVPVRSSAAVSRLPDNAQALPG